MDSWALAEIEDLPPEWLADEEHPANDRFYRAQERIQRAIVAQSAMCGARHTQVIKLLHQGRSSREVAKATGFSETSVWRIKNRPESKKLASMLVHLSQLRAGPTEEVRQHMLWRIAAKHETEDPRLSIQALQEINRMTGAHESSKDQPQAVHIHLNQEYFPKTALDG